MKLYRLKEEVKKYIHVPYPDAHNTLEYWEKVHVKREALEEVEERIKVNFHNVDIAHDGLHKGMGDVSWTQEEREFIEFCLNEIGSKEKLIDYSTAWAKMRDNNLVNSSLPFTTFLENKE